MSGNKYPEIRVKYAEVTKQLGPKDFAIIKGALSERGGFDGKVITEILTQFGVKDKALERLGKFVSSEQTAAPLNDEDALNAFLLCCLTSAALGEEELSTIRGYDRDEFYTTIRRLYHGARKSIRTQK